jgi:hypothetical protein
LQVKVKVVPAGRAVDQQGHNAEQRDEHAP